MSQNSQMKTNESLSWMATCRMSHDLGEAPHSCNMEHAISKTSFLWSDKHTTKWQSNLNALSGPLATKTSGPVLPPLSRTYVFYCLLVIFRQPHGMLPGLLWFILLHEFTANKHNNISHFNVLEAWAEVWMQAGQARPAHCEPKVLQCRMPAKSPVKWTQGNS